MIPDEERDECSNCRDYKKNRKPFNFTKSFFDIED